MNRSGAKPSAAAADEGGNRGNQAMPPACPRCELTKSQFTRTIQNYQKAYRKKVEGLKAELKSTRNTNTRLSKQVKSLKSIARVHLPSVAIGTLVGVLAASLWRRLAGRSKASDSVESDEVEKLDNQPVAAVTSPSTAV